MSGAPTPQALPSAFGINAVNPTYINTIPNTTVTDGRASFSLGFPPLTMTPIIAGGKPPFGQDVNGILYMLSTWAYYQQAGEIPRFSSTVATAITGYSLGTLLRSTDGATLWFNIVDGNVTDPDGGGAVGWVPVESYGLANIAGVTGGATTLTPQQAAKSFIVLSGALVANAQVVLPAHVRSWLIVNNCSGGFTVTVKTASGTGVVVPVGGGFAAPVGVYGDGTNIYPVVTPLSIPTAEGPTPSTYPIRSAAGYLYAVFFNMSGAADNLAVTDVVYMNGSDGFLRHMSQANFRAQLFVDAVLTGTPTAPTPAPGDSSTKIATTAFIQASAARGGRMDGAGAAIAIPAGWATSRLSLGQYRVTHNRGSLAYGATVTMLNTNPPPRKQVSIFNVLADSFDFAWFNQTDGNVYVDTPSSFTVAPN